jgi:purine-binding chemotaxis protein CheW
MVDSPSSASNNPEAENKKTRQFVGFELAGQKYAFPIHMIQEIGLPAPVTPLPQVADCVEGVSNLRGSIIPIINLRKLLDLPSKPADKETRTIVVNAGHRTLGCTVDSVHLRRIPDDEIHPAPESVNLDGQDFVTGIAQQDDGLVVLLDVEKLLDTEMLKHTPS